MSFGICGQPLCLGRAVYRRVIPIIPKNSTVMAREYWKMCSWSWLGHYTVALRESCSHSPISLAFGLPIYKVYLVNILYCVRLARGAQMCSPRFTNHKASKNHRCFSESGSWQMLIQSFSKRETEAESKVGFKVHSFLLQASPRPQGASKASHIRPGEPGAGVGVQRPLRRGGKKWKQGKGWQGEKGVEALQGGGRQGAWGRSSL